MYGTVYLDGDAASCTDTGDLGKFAGFIDWLRARSDPHETTFLDYGCGAQPITLKVAKELGMNAKGVEFDKEVRAIASAYAGCPIFAPESVSDHQEKVDVVFLGDVLEHVNDPRRLLYDLSGILSEDGLIYIQGPLEGARTFLHLFVSCFTILKPGVDDSIPPYHVSLATRKSVVELVHGVDFRIHHIAVTEDQWPAPTLQEALTAPSVRSFVLAILKRMDEVLAHLMRNQGNRFTVIVSKHSP